MNTTFGRYQLLRRLAVGGMAEIFLASSASIDGFEKTLVIKKIRPDLSSDQQFYSMFIDEARITISFSHPNVVHVFDFGKADDSYYLAMEYVRGCDVGTLLQLDDSKQGMPQDLSLFIISEVCKGLEYAHGVHGERGERMGVVHRDISPANILTSFHGGVKVGDFGIAEAQGATTQSMPGMVMGKLSYMSPEHAGGKVVDRRTDIFSCGIVLWEMLVGKNPYGRIVNDTFLRRIRKGLIDPPSTVNTAIPPALDDLVMKALHPDREQRYATGREFGHAIHNYLVTHHPACNVFSLQAYLTGHTDSILEHLQEAADDADSSLKEVLLEEPKEAPRTKLVLSAQSSDDFAWSPRMVSAVEAFQKHPNLWTIVGMGDICAREDNIDAALEAYRIAAVKFAQGGLLAQCLMCCNRMLRCTSMDLAGDEIAGMLDHDGVEEDALGPWLYPSDGPLASTMRELLKDHSPRAGRRGEGTPLLSHFPGEIFANLAAMGNLRSYPAGSNIVEQGEGGSTMFLLCRGRVLVHANGGDGKRIYLSSLTAGDFFGENSFFTGGKRSATIEALYDSDVLEITRELYDSIMAGAEDANAILLQFYKERIVETMLAVSPNFGLLSNADRRALVQRFALRVFQPGELLIQEGERSDQIYLVKTGTAEVFTEKGGPRTSLSSIGAGSIVGEVAALRGVPRTASVVATTRLETLELPGAEFNRVLKSQPEIKSQIVDEVAKRTRENMDKLMGPSPFAQNMPKR